jgi:hypothetical protein
MEWLAKYEPTGTKWQDSHFAQPQVARRAKCMDALSESIHAVPRNEVPNAVREKALNYGFWLYFLVFILFSRTALNPSKSRLFFDFQLSSVRFLSFRDRFRVYFIHL